jgi:hypothetical protein
MRLTKTPKCPQASSASRDAAAAAAAPNVARLPACERRSWILRRMCVQAQEWSAIRAALAACTDACQTPAEHIAMTQHSRVKPET